MYEGDTRVKTLIDDWRSEGNLLILNTIYDLTPAQYIGMLVTEVGCVPVTSVPVILREYRKDIDNVDVAAEIAEYD